MQPEQTAPRHGRPPSQPRAVSARPDGDPMRGACRRQEAVETPQEASRGLGRRTRMQQTDDTRRGRCSSISRGDARGGLDGAATLEISLPLDARAPGAARVVVECLRGRLAPGVLEDVRLVVSELVTNSVRHSGAPGGALVELLVELNATVVRVEVADPGASGVVAAHTPDVERGGGFGLNLVTTLAERWAVERVIGSETRVWAELPRAAARVGVADGVAGEAVGRES